jgi:sporulation protein YlmC with PRC-barrel domain
MKEQTRFIPTSRLKRYDVVNKKGQDMGQVQTFVIDMVAGRIAFVVVSFEGFLGINDKWFAMPWELLSWSTDKKKFILDMPQDVLEKAPGMDKNKWPDNVDFGLIAKSYSHFGVAPYWESSYDYPNKEIIVQKYKFKIENVTYEWAKQFITGQEVRAVGPGIPANMDLFLKVTGKPGRLIANGESVDLSPIEIAKFYSQQTSSTAGTN